MHQAFHGERQLYSPISLFYQAKFGEKVWKISVSTAETCPNREGLRGMKTCNFCDVWGSAAYPEIRERALSEQIEKTRDTMRANYKANKFLVYFQAYTNTFSKTQKLRDQFSVAFSYEDVVGAVVGTRPDCLSEAVFDLWNEWAEKKFIAVEMGVQSFDEQQLVWMRRGHTAEKSIQAIHKIKEKCPRVDLGIHLMFGLPGETDADIIDAARITNSLPIDNVKLHNLHVLTNTPLAEDFARGEFTPIDQATYAHRVILFLQHLKPEIAVHRLSALASRTDELVAPAWTGKKMEIYQNIIDLMKAQGAYQGQKVPSSFLVKDDNDFQ